MFKLWDIVLLDFSPSRWMEIKKTRPAMVLSCNTINANSPFLIVSPITSNTKTILHTHFLIEEKYKFLEKKSKIIIEQLKSIDQSRVIKKIWSLNSDDLEIIKEKIKYCFSL